MDPKPVTVGPEMRVGEVARVLIKKRANGAAVVDDGGRFLGFISAQGLMKALNDYVHDDVPPGPVNRYLDPESPSLSEGSALMDATQVFANSGYQLWAVPVLRAERIVGVVTRLDVVRAVMGYFGRQKSQEPETLYISALKEPGEKPPY
jgi:CBS domain-containing protein